MKLVAEACEDTERSLQRSRKRFGGLEVSLMLSYAHEQENLVEELKEQMAQEHTDVSKSLKRISFKDFLQLLSRVRAWNQQSLREELAPHFQKRLRRRMNPCAVV